MRIVGFCRPVQGTERVPINIHPDVRERLSRLLYQPEVREADFPPGYSAFINRACEIAESEIAELRTVRRADHRPQVAPETGRDLDALPQIRRWVSRLFASGHRVRGSYEEWRQR